ncbi:uncharacterized protein ACA1_299810 [Acanthamoeba castellanii str. Neff]|uniref:Uncharacterized protein n=1 Tax=Acanthamoeba castellanii (strain ATCC 30010 / Neff) TaxID=1257118 RepID=L8GEH8_ACACF|nr:uncharacterized protein ACA1_299810 [Acanthamoeba castellanii str. Neff]ELR11093.1 hypothetical protein ACA1_299810 [Acanthamoeba castellanii str. Neff]
MSTVEGVWAELKNVGKVTRRRSEEWYSFEVDYDKLNASASVLAGIAAFSSHMWIMDTMRAEKKGWKWYGDTQVVVYKFTAPSMREAIITAIVGTAVSGSGAGRFSSPNQSFYVESNSDGSWADFWRRTAQGDNDLPKWEGAPRVTVNLVQTGNTCCTLAQKDDKTFILVDYLTS